MATAVDRPDPGPLLTIAQASKLLSVHPQTLYVQIAAGRVPGVLRLGRVIRIHREKLLSGLAEKSETGPHVREGHQVDRQDRHKPGRRGRR